MPQKYVVSDCKLKVISISPTSTKQKLSQQSIEAKFTAIYDHNANVVRTATIKNIEDKLKDEEKDPDEKTENPDIPVSPDDQDKKNS